jgi:hypothetical protein
MLEDYDPERCITAGELRAMGMELPVHILDSAWIERNGYYAEVDNEREAYADSSGLVNIPVVVRFRKPFRTGLISVSITAEDLNYCGDEPPQSSRRT